MAKSMQKTIQCDELVRIRKASEMEYRAGICLGEGPEGSYRNPPSGQSTFQSRFEVRTSRMQVYSFTAGTTGWVKYRIRKTLLSKRNHNFGSFNTTSDSAGYQRHVQGNVRMDQFSFMIVTGMFPVICITKYTHVLSNDASRPFDD
jgi:hypothetical protein